MHRRTKKQCNSNQCATHPDPLEIAEIHSVSDNQSVKGSGTNNQQEPLNKHWHDVLIPKIFNEICAIHSRPPL
jgi:hypothetical protein